MKTHPTCRNKTIGKFLISAIMLNGVGHLQVPWTPVMAQHKALIVSAEQPNIWTLEQAHYLLAQMHRRNLDLKATGVGALDPNEINGLNLEVLRTLIEFGVAYDDAARFNNSLLKPQKQFDADRSMRLQKRRDELADESFVLSRDIARLGRERALATNQEEKDSLGARITELTSVRDSNDKEVARLDGDIKNAGGPSGNVQNTDPPARTGVDKLPTSSFDDSFKEVTKSLINRFNEAPKLNASLRLDNFLQMQYEIIAKQLTLLRDEVGPGERIIFLEMPQTVNSTYDKANKKWAQSWWKVAGYTTPRKPVIDNRERSNKRQDADLTDSEPEQNSFTETKCATFFKTYDLRDAGKLAATLKEGKGAVTSYIVQSFSPATRQLIEKYDTKKTPDASSIRALVTELNSLLTDSNFFQSSRFEEVTLTAQTRQMASQPLRGEKLIRLNRRLLEELYPDAINPCTADDESVTTRMIVESAKAAYGVDGTGSSDRVRYERLDDVDEKGSRIEDRSIRTIELIPRQGSLNVNDVKLRVRSGALTAIARTLFGFGASLNVQRQRETFSQFVQQELYSSSFGKGSREFGWTFSPMPGTERVLSGVKTTYAVMVVPNEAEALVLQSNGCYFPRSEYQPENFANTLKERWTNSNQESRNCSGQKTFAVPIPGGGDDRDYDFRVDGLEYVPVDNTDRVVLSIYGRRFPAQIGMMVDGIPLTQSIGVAQPLIRDDSQAFAAASAELKDSKVLGRIERIDANQIVAVFERPSGKNGTQPTLTLTAPGKAKTLNFLKLYINGTRNAVLNDPSTDLLFGKRAGDKAKFRIDKVEIFRGIASGTLRAAVSGAGFYGSGSSMLSRVMVNGTTPNYTIESSTLLHITFPIPADESIKVVLIARDPDPAKSPTIESNPVSNPARLRVTNVTIISYEPRTEEEPGTLVVKVEGSGFSDDLRAYLTEVAAANALKIAVKSATEALIKIDNPDAALWVILRDSQTGQETKTIITRNSPPK